MDQCRVSIHDLSYVGTPARFNMPFELGLACNLRRLGSLQHDFFIMERVNYRVQQTLSDIMGHDPLIHHGTVRGVIWCVLDALGTDSDKQPALKKVLRIDRTLWKIAAKLKKDARRSTIFGRFLFLELVSIATDLAQEAGFIE
jgi:hypothetical protein